MISSVRFDSRRFLAAVATCGTMVVMAACASEVTSPGTDADVLEFDGQRGGHNKDGRQPIGANKDGGPTGGGKKDGGESAGGKKDSSAPAMADFFFVSNASGNDQIWIHENGATRQLTWTDMPNAEPHGAAGRLVFSSSRDGNAEIYVASWDGSGATRLTDHGSYDGSPSLSPPGDRIAWVTRRSGVHRIWVMNADGSDQAPLETGAPGYNPERSPSWSPDGAMIAFSSTRTGTSQIFVMPAAGGAAVQVTREPGGAFEPAWSSDATSIYYVEASSTARIRGVTLATGLVEAVATDAEGAGQPACSATLCLFTGGAYEGRGDILSVKFAKKGNVLAGVLTSAAKEQKAAFVVR